MRHFAFSAPEDDAFETLAEANEHLYRKSAEKNLEELSDGRIAADTFEEEKPFLLAEVPPMPCFIKKTGCSVDKYSTVSVNNVRYSVPDIYTKKKVDIRIYTDRIVAYKGSEVIAEHPRCYKQGSYQLDIFHYLRTLRRKPGALPQSTALLQSDTLIKNIYEKYYSNDARTFLHVLEIIKAKGAGTVLAAIEKLVKISPLDLSAEKVEVISCNLTNNDNFITTGEYSPLSPLGRKIKSSLTQYDRLMEVMSQRRRAIS